MASGLGGCGPARQPDDTSTADAGFPRADRPVSPAGATQFSTEAQRDNQDEAQEVMDLAGVRPGMTVADVGAGEGYYTVRLAARVGRKGRVLAQDIDDGALHRLGARVERERMTNVSVQRGAPGDPRLPARSFDRVLMVHMYHEVSEPYAFLWHLWPALRKGGQVAVVDRDLPTDRHGIPPTLLFCEFEAAGFRLIAFHRKPEISGYHAQFEAAGNRPEPGEMRSCRIESGKVARTKGR
ncbi:methyltransferase domain-containing protein [Novosphingobium sp. KCTC 2891]|nr:methyltransferase domain-containing protein [Novosphingobium sp. KCTC 2891]